MRENPFLPPTFQQRKDFNFVQEHFRVQTIQSPNSSLWSAISPNSALSSNVATPQRVTNTSTAETSSNISRNQLNLSNSLTPPRNTILSPSSFIPKIRLPSNHPDRTRATPVYNPNQPTRGRNSEQTYIFALDHKI